MKARYWELALAIVLMAGWYFLDMRNYKPFHVDCSIPGQDYASQACPK